MSPHPGSKRNPLEPAGKLIITFLLVVEFLKIIGKFVDKTRKIYNFNIHFCFLIFLDKLMFELKKMKNKSGVMDKFSG